MQVQVDVGVLVEPGGRAELDVHAFAQGQQHGRGKFASGDRAAAWFDKHTDIDLHLHAKDLAPALDEFLRCAHTDVRVSWQEMSRTRVSYDVDAHALNDASRARLRALARYVQEDTSVSKLYIDGHTDGSGDKRANHRLSKRRAETVAAYLRECGLTDAQMVIRYHGATYPVADNNTAHGKAQNRRTTVRLSRTGTHTALTHR